MELTHLAYKGPPPLALLTRFSFLDNLIRKVNHSITRGQDSLTLFEAVL